MTPTLKTLIAGAALLAPIFAQSASAQDSYPQLVGSGENLEIDYGPGPLGNTVGGGAVTVSGSGENVDLRHLDATAVQAPRPGFVPVMIGSGESSTTVWVPAGTDSARLALIGSDGTLPAEVSFGSGFLAQPFGGNSTRG
jgi:hypothetical protein